MRTGALWPFRAKSSRGDLTTPHIVPFKRRASELLSVATLIKSVATAAVGLLLGLASASLVLSRESPFDVLHLGPWTLETKAGSLDADPFTRAQLERTGAIPLGLGEGLQFVARTDESGRALDPHCAYRVGPRAPAARYWTLEAADATGFPIANPAERYVLRSSEISRKENGAFEIFVSPLAHAGNWLPVGPSASLILILRLYDSPLGAASGEIEKAAAPTIVREACA